MAATDREDMTLSQKQREALARQQARDELTPAQQLKVLDDRLGVGVGAERERSRLQVQIDNEKGE